ADMMYPQELYNKGFSPLPPLIYASGTLIMWTALPDKEVSMEYLLSDEVKHIAIPNPKLAPYGRAVLEVLDYYGIRDKIQSKIVYGESISQTNQFITTKVAEVGFTAKSVVVLPEMDDVGHWVEIDKRAYSAINQGAVIVSKEPKKLKDAGEFYQYLFSKEANNIFAYYGYGINERIFNE
ncbi:MAG: molybdate ABC transporter substrate-binding protein, partial [Cyclobacteriaceae bacterium]|nr:molybdate ABC transporter substrate-binding protein [Cyclobacteriaceae bacterium]